MQSFNWNFTTNHLLPESRHQTLSSACHFLKTIPHQFHAPLRQHGRAEYWLLSDVWCRWGSAQYSHSYRIILKGVFGFCPFIKRRTGLNQRHPQKNICSESKPSKILRGMPKCPISFPPRSSWQSMHPFLSNTLASLQGEGMCLGRYMQGFQH